VNLSQSTLLLEAVESDEMLEGGPKMETLLFSYVVVDYSGQEVFDLDGPGLFLTTVND